MKTELRNKKSLKIIGQPGRNGLISVGLLLAAAVLFGFVPTVQAAVATISSAANQSFTVDDPATAMSTITIVDVDGNTIIGGKGATDIRIRIPTTFNMTWDTSVLTVTYGGGAAGKMKSTTPTYEDSNQTMKLAVNTTFAAGDTLTVSGAQFSNFTSPSAADNLELEVDNAGTVEDEDDKTITISYAPVANPVIASQVDQIFEVGAAATAISPILILDATTPQITSGNDIRIRIPAGFNMTWDNSDTTATIVGSASGKVSTTVSYEDSNRTLVLNVTSNFAGSDWIKVSGLSFTSFSGASSPDNLELEVNNDDAVTATDDKAIRVVTVAFGIFSADDQIFNVGDPATEMKTIMIIDATGGVITGGKGGNEIRIQIPTGFNMTWDTSITTVTFGGSAVAKMKSTTATYDVTTKIMMLDVDANFAAGDTLTVSGAKFTSFSAVSAVDNLELDTNNDATGDATDDKTITITDVIPLTSVSNSPSPGTVGATTSHTVAFTTADALPADGKIVVTFQAGFNLTNVDNSDISSSTMDGSFSVSTSGQVLTITRSGGSSQSAAAENIIIADITNTDTVGTSYTVDVETRDSGGTTINGPTTSSAFTVKGKSALANPATQVTDQLTAANGTQPTDVELVGFKITPTGENLTWTDLVVSLTYGGSMADADITNAEIYVDNGTVGTYESGTDTKVGAQSVNASGGSLTWNTVGGTISAATNYLIIFDAGATLSNGETVQAAVTAANITVTGATTSAAITTSGDVTTEPLHTVGEPATLADHAAGQEHDGLNGDVTQTGVEVFAFQISNATGATVTQNGFVFQLSAVNGMLQGDFDNFYIYIDSLPSGEEDGDIIPETETTKVCAAEGVTAIAGAIGTITFSSCGYNITNGTTVKMILTGDLANLAPGDSFTVDLGTDDLSPPAGGSDCTPTTHWVNGSNEYHYRRKITIDKAELGTCTADLTHFPLLVTLTGSDFSEVALATGATGDDIIFKDADGNQLDHEIEEFDKTTNNRLVAWVRVPTITYDRDTVIWMYYGNNSVTTPTENPAGVWDSNFKAVYHLVESGDGTADEFEDSSGEGNDGRGGNGNADQVPSQITSGKIGNAQDFDGSDDWIYIGDPLGSPSTVTVSGWVKHDNLTATNERYLDLNDNIVIRHCGGSSVGELNFYIRTGGGTINHLRVTGALAVDTWYHVAGTFDGTHQHVYLNGAEQLPSKDLTGQSLDAPGNGNISASGETMLGVIDEVRISNTARDACWIGTEYSNQKTGSILYTLGSQENLNYNYRKKIIIDAGSVIGANCAADLTDFPFLVTLTGSDFAQIADNVDSDGYDIIFKDVNGNRLDHEIEEYDETTDNRLAAWVRIPTLDYDRDTVIYLYYGNPAVTAPTENPAGVWDAGFVSVYHLSHTSGDAVDSVGNFTAEEYFDPDSNMDQTGIAGGADYFDGSDYLGTNPEWAVTGAHSYCAWVKFSTTGSNMVILEDGGTNVGDGLGITLAGNFRYGAFWNSTKYNADSSATYADGQWHYVCGVKEAGSPYNMHLYVDGGTPVTTASANYDPGTNDARIGTYNGADPVFNSGGTYFTGYLDEIRVSNTARDACWIQTEFNNQNAPAGTYTVGLEEGLNYLYRKKITVNASQIPKPSCASDISNFALLVTLTGTDFTDIEDDVDANGYALNFIAEDDAVCGGSGTAPCVLDHEIELYDTTGDKLVAWVRIPVLGYNDDTVIYLHYGNPNITASTANPAGVWDSNYKAVWHLGEEQSGTGTGDLYTDSTSNSYDGDDYVSATGKDGQIASGQQFDGSNDYVGMGNVLDYGQNDPVTYSAWIKTSGNNMQIAGKADNDGRYQGVWFYIGEFISGELGFYLYDDNFWSERSKYKASSGSLNDNQWHYVVATYTGNDSYTGITLYGDGSELVIGHSNDDTLGTVTNSYPFNIGAVNDGQGYAFNGYIDEVRLSNTVRNACWIGTEYSNQKAGATLVSVAAEERWTFDHYKTITIDKDYVGGDCGADLADFPVMIKITGDDFTEIANDVDADGYDIIFKDANGNQLAHEIEKYDETTDNELIAWVKVPRLAHTSDTVLTIHYGNDTISTPTANPAGVWDADYAAVWHLKESGNGTAGEFADSTGNGRNGTSSGYPSQVAGKIGYAQDYEDADYIDIPTPAFGLSNTATISLWQYGDAAIQPQADTIFDGTDASGLRVVNAHLPWSDSNVYWDAGNAIGYDRINKLAAAGEFEGQWNHWVFTKDAVSGAMKIYLNGAQWHSGTGMTRTMPTITAFKIGSNSAGASNYDGLIDEFRISGTVRDLCWIQTEYKNQNAPTTFYSIGSEQIFAFTTAIDLLSFTATGQNDAVQVAWETATETGNLGFYLYRADSPAGPFVRITDQLIAGLNDSVEGRIYTYPDTDVTAGQAYYYKLEDLDMDGRRTFHGPVGVNWDGAGAPVVAEGDPDPVTWVPGGEAGPVTVSAADEPVYKIMVAEEGLYRLTRDFLAGQSVALDKVDLSRVRLYHLGREVAVWVHDDNSDTVFDAADHITFYALPVAAEFAKYSADNVYWLTTGAGENPVKRMAAVDSAPDSAALATGFDATVRREQDQYYYPNAPGADEFDRWLNSTWVVGAEIAWQDAGQPITFTLDTSGATGTGTLTVALLGTYNTDHQVDISVNGGPTQTFSWSGIAFYEAVIEDAALVDGLNAISLTCKTGLDALLLDWLAADYPRNYAADSNQLIFTSSSPERFVVTGFAGAELLAFDITDPENVSRSINFQTSGSGPYSLEFTPSNATAQDRTYLVLSSAALLTPRAVTADAASNLTDSANGADYIVITHRNLGWDANGDPYAWLTDLLALRQAQGHRVTAVNLTDIYDEFAFGLATPAAIRDFLAYAAGFWTAPAPRYVLLVGDATYDYKDNWGSGTGDDVPTYTIFTRDAGETVTDEWYTAVSGGDAAPDLYIGRLPAATAAEAGVMVDKIVSYETAVNTKTWQNNIVLVADNMTREQEAVFESMNNDAAAVLPAALRPPFKAYLGDYDSAGALTADLLARIDAGSLLVNYSGHASVQIWAAERIFDTGDVPGLENAGRYPVIISMSCLSGYFAYPAAWNFPSLSEALMRAQDKGAVGMLVPTGQTDPTVQHILNTALFEAIFTADIRQLGAAIGRAKQIFLAGGSTTRTELSQTFALFGDPAMVLQVPLPRRPGGLSAQLTATNTVELAWNSALDSNGAAATGYHIYRATTDGGPYTRLTGTALTETAYSDAALTVGAAYYYVVTAIDADGDESVPSEESGVVLTDSDGDGLYDLLEAAGCTAVSLPDSDGDGLADGVEDANRNGSVDAGETDPCDSDSDGDGLPDGWEAANGLDPVSGSGAGGPDGDPDADGWTNYREYVSCTDPADAGSVPGAPIVPALNYPANGAETATRQPWLSISNADDADCQALRYVFELYADAQLTTLVAATPAGGEAEDDNTTAWQVDSLLNDNADYYWRARAYDGIGYSDWMATATFFVNTTPEAPTVPMVSAPPDASEVAVLQPTLEIVNASDVDRDALTYEFRVYADETLDTLVSSQTNVVQGAGGTTSWQVAVPLADDTHYWWVVQATDDDGLTGDWSSAAGFFVNTSNNAPTAPPGGSPADGAEAATTTPLLAVVHATDSDRDTLSYFFEIDVVDTFNSFELEQSAELAQQAGETTSWGPLELMDNTTCYWRVRAFDGRTYGPWHSSLFFVNTANDAPGVPTIDHPGDLSDVTTRQPTLAVKAAVDADLDVLDYEFELYADAQLTQPVTAATGVGLAWQVDETLTDNRGYFWRARAVDAHGAAGPWSATVSFFVNTANDPPRVPMLNNPVSGGTDTSLTPILSVFNAADLDQNALSYEFELYADADLSQLVSAATAAQGYQITSWSVSSALADGGIYYWRARAHDGQQPGSWMPTAVFEIHTAGADTQYEIQSRHEIFAGSLDPQDAAVAAADSPIFNTSVEIPPGALRDNCTILIGPVTNPPALPRNTRAIGRVTEFGPSGMTFNLPVVIKLPYTAAALRQARVVDPTELGVFYYDTSILAWVPVEIAGIDSINQLVSIETSHFSMYTIAAPLAEAASGGGGTGGCFIAAAAKAEAAVFKIDWPDTSLLGLLALFGLLWLGRRRKN